jgi:uncharacterized protein YPO0396
MMSGYRLVDLEVFNWGTFDKNIWHMALDGHGCLLTGENGTGKSTIIDAFLSLLVPNKRRSYNMSSGSERRERNETTYVRGAFQREKTRWDQIQVKYLRDEQSLSALAAHFSNPLTKDLITLAQFFWFESGELRKCLVISHTSFSLKTVLDKVKAAADLRRNLRQLPHTTIFSSFSEYQEYFVQYMGLRSPKGMDLFNQVSTIKQIGNLNEFVRQNMLEESDMEPILADFFRTFEDLTLAHEAITNARLQIESLDGIDKDARKLSDTTLQFERTTQLQVYLPRFFAATQNEILIQRQRELTEALAFNHSNAQSVEQAMESAQEKLSALMQGTDGKTREERLRLIHRELKDVEAMYQHCTDEHKKLEKIRRDLGFTEPLTPASFMKDLFKLEDMRSAMESEKVAMAQKMFGMKQEQSQIQLQMQELSAELLVAQKNKTLLPRQYIELRQMLCDKLNLHSRDLPYAAELMAVKSDEKEWRLAAEKLLRPLALKLLIPTERFMDANQVLRSRDIGMKIVLLSVDMERGGKFAINSGDDGFLVSKLEFLPKAKQSAWLQAHIREQFAFQCVNDMRAFRSAPRAVTVEGLIKRSPDTSEKDDRTMVNSQFLLGWAHEDKTQRLTEESKVLRGRLQAIQESLQKIESTEKQREYLLGLLAQRKFFDSFETVNISPWEKKRQELKAQQVLLMQEPKTKEIDALQQQFKTFAKNRDDVLAQGAIVQNELDKIPTQMKRLATLLAEHPLDDSADAELNRFIVKISGKNKSFHEVTPELEGRLAEMLRSQSTTLGETKNSLGLTLTRKLTAFKARFPELTVDMEGSLDDLPAFLHKYQTLKREALPAHEARFKKLISKSVITDLTAFKSTLELNAETIKENIEYLNTSLQSIPFSDMSYVQIRMARTKDPEIREFQSMLRNAIQMSGPEQSELDLEESFQRISTIIKKLKGDMKWSARVTDVRNWTDFFVAELAQSDHAALSFYSDSNGLSGGQKAKLAFTILASALAYQYGLNSETAREKSFRFVVIDEAFSKSDDRNSQYALELFRKLGLQLLVVTPLDKLDVIKPYVQRIFVTQIPSNDYRSQLAAIKIPPAMALS